MVLLVSVYTVIFIFFGSLGAIVYYINGIRRWYIMCQYLSSLKLYSAGHNMMVYREYMILDLFSLLGSLVEYSYLPRNASVMLYVSLKVYSKISPFVLRVFLTYSLRVWSFSWRSLWVLGMPKTLFHSPAVMPPRKLSVSLKLRAPKKQTLSCRQSNVGKYSSPVQEDDDG